MSFCLIAYLGLLMHKPALCDDICFESILISLRVPYGSHTGTSSVTKFWKTYLVTFNIEIELQFAFSKPEACSDLSTLGINKLETR